MPENFQDFLNELRQKDSQAWEKFTISVGIIIKHWIEEKRLEILWCADKGSLLTQDIYIKLVVDELKLIFEKQDDIPDFPSLKQLIIGINRKLLDKCFRQFMKLLINKDEKAWNLFSKNIKNNIYRFLKMENRLQITDLEEILQESLIVFAEKLTLGNLEFENSKKLKSFIIRIAQLKLYEKFRITKKQQDLLRIEDMNYNLPEIGSCQEISEDREYAAYLFKKLEKKEQLIIYYYFFEQKQLKEIAKKINVSEENCRILKYRALRKLRRIVKQNKEVQMLN